MQLTSPNAHRAGSSQHYKMHGSWSEQRETKLSRDQCIRSQRSGTAQNLVLVVTGQTGRLRPAVHTTIMP